MAAGSNRNLNEAQDANEENQQTIPDRWLEEGFKLDYWWIDAGWYPSKQGWQMTGTWEPDPKRFPNGFRPVADHLHSKGVKLILWFEPERVRPGTWLADNHPEWLLGREGENRLLYLGNPDALAWLISHVDKMITEQGIDLYRQDFNFSPLSIWRANDAEDRQGIAEIRHVTGYLAYWDESRRRHPNLLIDTCASGGRRNDLETLRRSVPLWRSDFAYETTAMQNHTYGLALWVPFFGTGINGIDAYTFRSQMTIGGAFGWDLRRRDRADYNLLRRLVAQWRQIAPFYYGDYYPMTSYSTRNDTWAAWQFDRPASGDGMVEAFRRRDCPFESARFKLRGLDPQARYSVKDLDSSVETEVEGRELMEHGLLVGLKSRPDSGLIVYQQAK
jgi:alpha-galactosidase